jgi:hypothetical protein
MKFMEKRKKISNHIAEENIYVSKTKKKKIQRRHRRQTGKKVLQ